MLYVLLLIAVFAVVFVLARPRFGEGVAALLGLFAAVLVAALVDPGVNVRVK